MENESQLIEILKRRYFSKKKYAAQHKNIGVFEDNVLICFFYWKENKLKQYIDSFSIYEINRNYDNISIFVDDYSKVSIKVLNDLQLKYYRRNAILSQLEKAKASGMDSNYSWICEDVNRDKGKWITSVSKEPVFLIGAVATDEDYYYVTINKNYEINYLSTVCGYIVLNDQDKFEELNYNIIKEKIRNIIEKGIKVPMVDFYQKEKLQN